MNKHNILLTSQEYLPHRNYWQEQLKELPHHFSIKILKNNRKTDLKRENITFPFNPTQQAIVSKLTQGRALETFIILLSAYTILLAKYAGHSQCIIDTPLLKRDNLTTAQTDTVTLITTVNFENTIKELIVQTNQIVTQSYKYQNFPIQLAATQLTGKLPFTQFFAYFSEIHTQLPILDAYDLVIAFDHSALTISYNSILFSVDFITNFANHYQNILANFANVNTSLKNITLLDETERQQILFDLNATQTNYPIDKNISQLFEAQVKITPNAVAIVFENTTLTYQALNEKTNQLAHYLHAHYQIQPDDFIAIILDRSEYMIIAILAILKAGGAYLPIEPDAPKARTQLMLDECHISIILTSSQYADQFKQAIDLPKLLSSLIDENNQNLPSLNQSTDLAYIMYTSGSTGKPKGVLVQQKGVIRLVKNTNYTAIKPSDHLLQLSNYAFDGSTYDIFAALLNGASLFLFPKELLLSIENLCHFIINHQINITFITTALFNKIIDINPSVISQFDKIYFGGQEASLKHVKIALQYRKNPDSIVHVYGPTENTTFSTYYVIDTLENDSTIPIGAPISNSQVYILDEQLNPLPIGVEGEIYVSGDGIARGYLNNTKLTEELFLNHPFMQNEKLYKTGDIGVWLTNGQIDFRGRRDEQVKIRGFRVELGEIENALLTHPNIRQAFVITRQLDDGNKELVAYIVGQVNITEIRAYLANNLPDYMIPAHFVSLDSLPLNLNGKVDKQALPTPESTSLTLGTTYVAPRTEIEQQLAAVWQKVLDKQKIGIYDNYFALGGDSIKAIQIASRLHQENLKVEVKDIFLHQTIAELAEQVGAVKNVINQSDISGNVPLTAVQAWLFEHYLLEHCAHFNQSILTKITQRLQSDALKQALAKLQYHHDALRMRYYRDKDQIIQENADVNCPVYLEVVDLRGQIEAMHYLQQHADRLQSSFHLSVAPLIKTVLYQLDDADYLLIIVHHLVIDGVSWRILLEDLQLAYQQALQGQTLCLPTKTDAFQTWAYRMHEYAKSETLLSELAYWQLLENKEIKPLVCDYESALNLEKDLKQFTFSLTVEETTDLLTKVNEVYRTEINDILLTALAISLYRWSGSTQTLLSLEGHGREAIVDDIDVGRTVGWFTSIYPVLLELAVENEIGYQIKSIKETLRKVPNKGIGYGILRYLTPKNLLSVPLTVTPQMSFNYLGQFEENQGDWALLTEGKGREINPEWQWLNKLDFVCYVVARQLHVVIHYSCSFNSDTITRLSSLYHQALQEVIIHCLKTDDASLTPSDIDYEGLKIDELDEMLAGLEQAFRDHS